MSEITLKETDTHDTPATGYQKIYVKTDGKLYRKEDDATETEIAGNVTGDSSSTDNAIVRFDGTDGKTLQNSSVTIDDSGNIITSANVDGRDLSTDGSKLDGIESGADVTDATNVAAAGAEMTANKNQVSGYAGLDGSSKLTGSQQVYGSSANTACEGNDSRLGVFPPGHLYKCNVSYYSATQIKISTGFCRDSANAYNITVSSELTVAITSSGANGLDTGTEATDQPYMVYVCVGSSGVCGLLSVSLTPTLPSGYDYGYRCVGSVVNHSGDFVNFTQVGVSCDRETIFNRVRSEGIVLSSGSATSWTDIDCSDWVPLSATQVLLGMYHVQDTAGRLAMLRPYGWTASTTGVPQLSATPELKRDMYVFVVDQKIQYQVDHSSSTLGANALGYKESL